MCHGRGVTEGKGNGDGRHNLEIALVDILAMNSVGSIPDVFYEMPVDIGDYPLSINEWQPLTTFCK